MNIVEFVSRYKNHPILFIGTGMSLRYLKHSYTWEGLLSKIAYELKENEEFYLDLKARCQENGQYRLERVASLLEKEFNKSLIENRNGKFEKINDIFYENMHKGINISRFKIYISEIFSSIEINDDKLEEIMELKKVRKNIGSIITTNYDKLIEEIFQFNPLIGNDILLSNPYGSLYKIHGCVSEPNKIIITKEDYDYFNQKYELIRAQLLSLFIHNPIIFMGYNIGDENIKSILKTIFTYIEPNSKEAEEIRGNFLLVEYDEGSMNEEISEHDIDMEGFSTIRINKIKTDNYISIYRALADLHLPISAMDIRKVQTVVNEIYSGGKIKVTITEDINSLKNGDKILAIGSSKTITYQYQTASEIMVNYFKIIDESNFQILTLVDKFKINKQQFFPIYGFSKINENIKCKDVLKEQQKNKLIDIKNSTPPYLRTKLTTIDEINKDAIISPSNKIKAILWSILEGNISLNIVEEYLRNYENKKSTDYRRLLCAYDYKKYC
ncbi:SIR2 family protein [Clostridium bornimense]|uniref:SIR2 family protein n=1 Tax=Clostridium bornimense TaxID=1216932 RepID=UPI001C1157EF|nr:SIR2 family protein [Clostridium bornimense]MBU5317651.1 SIR2 family protein [Clostridium bornimense]